MSRADEMTDFEQTKGHAERIIQTATDLHRRDLRTRALIDSSVHTAMDDYGPIDPEEAGRDAARIAQSACAILAARIFTEDAELHAIRAERDQYRKLAEEALSVSPRQIVIPA